MDSFFILEIALGICVPLTLVFWAFYEIIDFFFGELPYYDPLEL
jgi:hypothetical protein